MSGTRHKVFLITGVSSGFGQAFSRAALDAGHTVIGTVRSEEAREAFARQHPTLAHGVVLDVTDFQAIPSVVARAREAVGPVDVLVNNAGYGHEGTLEESPLEDLRRQFDVNVFGAVAMIKAVLPEMRQRRSGHIVNVTSMGGFITLPGISYYCGSKFALEGISEALAQEVKDFGVRVTAIAPGSFRTDWAGRSMVRSGRSIADYDALFDPIRQARQQKSGRQAGDPARAARILLEVVEAESPPVHLLLGTDALRLVRAKLDRLSEEIAAWEAVTRSTDFD
ncbi:MULTISPECIES: oxidoreductase [unclassified Corallococcus]|uniref:oxidoreductase n=1 Tax=unclassified Corallococcus TaxID=2685029 RepID=UPI001A8D71A3|nr:MULTISPECIES: oxidoreductase [unclassified Corallococcus]MBN9685487.1 oxidoreductase [Corallococcus sp. NCSPR001]WAS83065.1 oxidoreductase [Corallococcus sp. NCRR]